MSIKKELGEVLDEFPAHELQSTLVVVRHLMANAKKEDRIGNRVFSLPVSFFTDKGIAPKIIEESLSIFKRVYESRHEVSSSEIGIMNTPPLYPRIRIKDGEEVIESLMWVPVGEIERELLKREGYFISGDKIDISYSLKDGIYAIGSKLRPYKASKQKIKIIKLIHSGEAVRLKEITKKGLISNEANASRDIREINKEFIEKLKLEHEFILHNTAAGYHLNTAIYNISGH